MTSTSGSPFFPLFSVHCLVIDVFPCHLHVFNISRDCVSPRGAWSTLLSLLIRNPMQCLFCSSGLGRLDKYQDGIGYSRTVTHLSTNPARRRATSLMCPTELPLSQTGKPLMPPMHPVGWVPMLLASKYSEVSCRRRQSVGVSWRP